MSNPVYECDIISGNSVTLEQEQFVNHWYQRYFGQVAVAKGLNHAPVHWRLILRNGEALLSHIALTELTVEMNGELKRVGAVGGLFTPTHLQGLGYGTSIMDRAEEFIFERLKLSVAILFCLPELVTFYTKRRWSLVTSPVTLEQKTGPIIWGAAVMLLSVDRSQSGNHHIHVPISSRYSNHN